jgi:hypothetical protein
LRLVQAHDLVGRLLQPPCPVEQFRMRAAALLAGVGRQLHAVDGEQLAPDQPLRIAGQQHLVEQRLDLRSQAAEELGQLRVAGVAVPADRDELDVVLAGPLQLPARHQTAAVTPQHDLEQHAWVVGAGAHGLVAKPRV